MTKQIEATLDEKALLLEVGTTMVSLLNMLAVAAETPQCRFEVDFHEQEKHACIVKMFWGEFVVMRLPDDGPMQNVWTLLLPIECDQHGREWAPVPLASTLPHMLRTGLCQSIDSYMAKEIGTVRVTPGTVVH